MKEFIQLFRNVLAPEKNWGVFTRKVLGVTLCVSVGAYGWNLYNQSHQPRTEVPVHVVLSESNVRQREVRETLERIMRADSRIESIWLYSWPDARQIMPVMYVGDSLNPLPRGSFIPVDAEALGTFLFGECYQLERNFQNVTCPINGFQDSWGIIVVNYRDGTSQSHIQYQFQHIEAAAQRIGLMLYSNDNHLNQIRD